MSDDLIPSEVKGGLGGAIIVGVNMILNFFKSKKATEKSEKLEERVSHLEKKDAADTVKLDNVLELAKKIDGKLDKMAEQRLEDLKEEITGEHKVFSNRG